MIQILDIETAITFSKQRHNKLHNSVILDIEDLLREINKIQPHL